MKGLLNDFVTDCFIATLYITHSDENQPSFPEPDFFTPGLWEGGYTRGHEITKHFIRLSRLKNNLAQIHH